MGKLAGVETRKRLRHTRDAIVAGIFYPSSPEELDKAIDDLAKAAPAAPRGACQAILSPHGSLQYSGALAVRAWMACADINAETIVIISPSHRDFEPGIFLPESRDFVVPNGSFEVDHALLKDLAHSSTTVRVDDIPHLEELAVEMQLIFASRWFPRAKILPIIAGGIQDIEMERLFATLSLSLESRQESTLIVITSNMAISEEKDDCLAKTKAFIESLTGPGRDAAMPPGSRPESFCGCKIISAFMGSRLARNMVPECFGYSTSAAFADEGDPVVGYAALGFSR